MCIYIYFLVYFFNFPTTIYDKCHPLGNHKPVGPKTFSDSLFSIRQKIKWQVVFIFKLSECLRFVITNSYNSNIIFFKLTINIAEPTSLFNSSRRICHWEKINNDPHSLVVRQIMNFSILITK